MGFIIQNDHERLFINGCAFHTRDELAQCLDSLDADQKTLIYDHIFASLCPQWLHEFLTDRIIERYGDQRKGNDL